MARQRYEIRDTTRPEWRGQRFTNEDRARRELAQCVGDPGRWILIDRETGQEMGRR